jgi:hypothetical protein
LSAYRSYDDFIPRRHPLRLEHQLVSLQWSAAITPALLFTSTACTRTMNQGLKACSGYRVPISSTIQHRELKAGLLYSPSESTKWKWAGT